MVDVFLVDVVIITQQLDTKLAKKSFLATVKSLYREEGIRAFTKGLWTSILQQYFTEKIQSFLRRILWTTLPDLVPPMAIETLISFVGTLVLLANYYISLTTV